MIGIGGTVYLSCDNKYIGALLFTVGLCTICTLGMSLFTGMISYARNTDDYAQMAIVWIGNLVGAVLTGLLIMVAKPETHELSVLLCNAKMTQTPYKTAILSVMCGVLMYAAVYPFRCMRGISRYIGILICVPSFIVCGFEHSVADMFYFSAGACGLYEVDKVISYILLVTLGNAIGAITFRVAHDYIFKIYPPNK